MFNFVVEPTDSGGNFVNQENLSMKFQNSWDENEHSSDTKLMCVL